MLAYFCTPVNYTHKMFQHLSTCHRDNLFFYDHKNIYTISCWRHFFFKINFRILAWIIFAIIFFLEKNEVFLIESLLLNLILKLKFGHHISYKLLPKTAEWIYPSSKILRTQSYIYMCGLAVRFSCAFSWHKPNENQNYGPRYVNCLGQLL